MKVKCDYCGNYLNDTEQYCPTCGAINSQYQRVSSETPKTIAQLQQWYTAHHLPPEQVTRFFIGKNVNEPKAFGIYEDHGRFIVYKNKADGSRAIRYDGNDEAYAVNELYMRLKEEIANQKNINKQKQTNRSNYTTPTPHTSRQRAVKRSKRGVRFVVIYMIFLSVFIIGSMSLFGLLSKNNGYYAYNDNVYYLRNQNWYLYSDDSDSWDQTTQPFDTDDYDTYSIPTSEGNSMVGQNFSDSQWAPSSSSDDDWGNDWDNDSDWDSGSSWDSGGSDWDSDW